MQKVMQKTVLLLVSGLFLAGCHSLGHKKRCGCKKKDLSAVAEIKSVSKASVKGRVQFDRAGRGKVQVTAEVKGLKPNTQLGFHLHEFGDCSNKGLSAGGHFNPKGHRHGGPSDKERHLGDLGNLKTDAKGQAVYSKVVSGKLYKFLGRSVVIHSKADDLKTQPTGASGRRVACGVVGAVRKLSSVKAGSAAPPATPKKAVQKTAKKAVVKKVTKKAAKKTVVKKAAKKVATKAAEKSDEKAVKKAAEKSVKKAVKKAEKTKAVPVVTTKTSADTAPTVKKSVTVKPAVAVSKGKKAVQKAVDSAVTEKKKSAGDSPKTETGATASKKTTKPAGTATTTQTQPKPTAGTVPSASAIGDKKK